MTSRRSNIKIHHQQGLSLLEMAVIILIISILIVSSVRLTRPYWQMAQVNSTNSKLEAIDKALAQFARQYGRLPCPSNPLAAGPEPFGTPRNSGVNGTEVTNRCNSTVLSNTDNMGAFYGIVPFRTLGLLEVDVRDGWGNYITYAVSPIAAGRDGDSAPGTGNNDQIHAYCRQRHWLDRDTTTSVNHLNLRKANLCCPYYDDNSGPQTNNITITDATGFSVLIPSQSTNLLDYTIPTARSASVSPLTQAILTATATATGTSQFIAYVLVSHGQNGSGAFTGRAAPLQYAPASMGINETENSDFDATFVLRNLSTNIASVDGYYDDILSWKTNHQIVALFRNDSCSSPYPILGDR